MKFLVLGAALLLMAACEPATSVDENTKVPLFRYNGGVVALLETCRNGDRVYIIIGADKSALAVSPNPAGCEGSKEGK